LFARNSYNLKSTWRKVLIIPFWYILSVVFAVLDIVLLGELITFLIRITSRKTRSLSSEEICLFSHLENDQHYLWGITVIESSWVARLGKRLSRRNSLGLGIARTVHFSREISLEKDKAWVVHEVAHTLQYKYRGLCYIPEALISQRFSGYDYGGKKTLLEEKSIKRFNPEQQAEIFTTLTIRPCKSQLNQEVVEGNW